MGRSIQPVTNTIHRFATNIRIIWLFCFIASISSILILVTRSSSGAKRTGQGFPYQYDANLDPELGVKAPSLYGRDESGNTRQIVPGEENRPVVVVFLGACVGCDAQRLAKALRGNKLPKTVSIIGIVEGTSSQLGFLRESCENLYEPLLNTTPQQYEVYNVKWTPRLFVVDEDEKLIYAQPEFCGISTAFQEAVNRLTRSK